MALGGGGRRDWLTSAWARRRGVRRPPHLAAEGLPPPISGTGFPQLYQAISVKTVARCELD